jgi:hypothetical protein
MDDKITKDPIGVLEGFSPATPYNPSDEEKKLLGLLDQRLAEATDDRTTIEQVWELGKCYYNGDYVLAKNTVTGDLVKFRKENADSEENIVRPIARALVGKLSRIIPTCTVLPASDDQGDLKASQAAESFLDYIFRKEKMRLKYLQGQKQLTWSGTAVYQVAWDKDAGQKVSWCEECGYNGEKESAGEDCPQCMMGLMEEDMMAEVPTLAEINEGDIRFILHDIGDFYPEPGVKDPNKMRWCCVKRAVPVSEVRRRFPHKAEHIASTDGIYESHFLEDDVLPLNDHTFLLEWHEVPTAEFPEGRLIFSTATMILSEQPSPYGDLGRLPFFFHRFDPNPTEFWGRPFVSNCHKIQDERNHLLSQIKKNRELTNNPKLKVPFGSGISADRMNTVAGEVIKYKPHAGEVKYLEIPGFANYVYSELERLEAAVMKQAGVTEHEMGVSSPEQSGRYAAILDSQSQESISSVIVENVEEWKEIHRAVIIMAQKYYDDNRTYSVLGSDKLHNYSWKDADLKSGWDITLNEDDSLSKNPAIRLSQAERLLQSGIFIDPATGMPDVKAFSKMAGIQLPGSTIDTAGAERAYFSQVPEMIAQGKEVNPKPWDDAKIAAEELLIWLRGAGRSSPQPLVDQVSQLWMGYVSIMQPTAMDADIMPNGMGQPQQQPGQGQGQGPGQSTPSMGSSPEQTIQQADSAGETLARPGPMHEG